MLFRNFLVAMRLLFIDMIFIFCQVPMLYLKKKFNGWSSGIMTSVTSNAKHCNLLLIELQTMPTWWSVSQDVIWISFFMRMLIIQTNAIGYSSGTTARILPPTIYRMVYWRLGVLAKQFSKITISKLVFPFW